MPSIRRALCLLLALLLGCIRAGAAEPAKSLVGVNTDRIEFYSPMCATIDAIKSSQRFGSARNPGDGRCPLDEHGWPKSDCGVVIADGVAKMAGVYKFSCEGRASVSGIWGRTAVKNVKFDGKITTADVEYKSGGAFALTISNTDGGVRNIKLLRPGYSSDADVFTKEYLASKEPFGAIRLMNWTRTNDSPVTKWDQRCTPDDAQWSSPNGGPWEPWLDYAVKHQKDLWLCVPHLADDDYVKNLALLCKQHLGDAPVHLYVEDTNEYWNRQFKQERWIEQQVKDHAEEWKLNDPPAGDLRHRYHAKRTVEIGRIFREVFGAADARVRPILSGQLAGAGGTEDAAMWIEKQYGPLKEQVYGVACAPYFGNFGPATSLTATADELADHLLSTAKKYSTPASPTAMAAQRFTALAKSKGIHSLAYEGGADIGQGPPGKVSKEINQRYLAVRTEAQTRPTTGQAVGEYLDWWFNAGGQEFFYYKDFSPYGRSGFFGLSNVPGKIDTPKYQAAIAAAGKHMTDATPEGK